MNRRASLLLCLLTTTLGTCETSRRDPVKSAYEVKAVVRRTSSEGRI
jgi:hypothetical protein